MIRMQKRPTKQQVSQTASVQAPTGGLNARDPVANMKETEAVTLDNWFPTPSDVQVRKGHADHCTGFASPVETLAKYSNGVIQKLFGISGGSIYDVTTAGAHGAAAVSGLTNSRWQHVLMGTPGGSFLAMVNGIDDMRQYDGTTWKTINALSTPAITGIATNKIAHINNFKNRLWMIERESMRAWYLPISSIAGAANSLDLGGLFKNGGYLMAMANWTIDNAAGIDDYAAFITSEGEVAIYKGTDPSSAATWALVGTFVMGKPLGRRCYVKAGADVLVLTTDGAFPLSKAMLTDRSQLQLAVTDKISDLVNTDALAFPDNFGWQPIVYPSGKKLIINVPRVENAEQIQYVMNTNHGAWCRFTGWNANCFEIMGNDLYFGGATAVCLADSGQSDNGSNINAVCQQAYSYFRQRGRQKHFKMVRPVFMSEGVINPAVVINVDFQQNRSGVAPSFSGGGGTPWDFGTWDVAEWESGDRITKRWQNAPAIGIAAGLRVSVAIKDVSCKWQSTDFLFETGSVL